MSIDPIDRIGTLPEIPIETKVSRFSTDSEWRLAEHHDPRITLVMLDTHSVVDTA